tara:strand:- start:2951 stop:3103 length:153 start_codon:yes stop_codon:yes gene_type:complete
MGPKFFQTLMGKRFIEGTVPSIIHQLKRLNENLERIATALEKKEEEEREE